MADSAGLRWYTTGTVGLTANSATVTGANTGWSSAGIKPGDIFTIDAKTLYEVASVNSNTSITLDRVFDGTTSSGTHYYIIRNFAATTPAELAAAIAELVRKYENYIDTDLAQIKGEKADFSEQYRGAWKSGVLYNQLDVVLHNNVFYMTHSNHTSSSSNAPGTTTSLWVTVSAEIPIDIINSIQSELDSTTPKAEAAYSYTKYEDGLQASLSIGWNGGNNDVNVNTIITDRKRHVRGANLGSKLTRAQNKAMKDYTYEDIYLGDYWETSMTYSIPAGLPIQEAGTTITKKVRWRIVGFNLPATMSYCGGVIIRAELPLFWSVMNTADEKPSGGWTSGGYYYSSMHQSVMPAADSIFLQFFQCRDVPTAKGLPKYNIGINGHIWPKGNFAAGVGWSSFGGGDQNSAALVHSNADSDDDLDSWTKAHNYTHIGFQQRCGWIPTNRELFGEEGWNGLRTQGAASLGNLEQFDLYKILGPRFPMIYEPGSNYIGGVHFWISDAISADQYLGYYQGGNGTPSATGLRRGYSANSYAGVCPAWIYYPASEEEWEAYKGDDE